MGDNDRVLGRDHGGRVLKVPKDLKAGPHDDRIVASVVDQNGKVVKRMSIKATARGSMRLKPGESLTTSAYRANGDKPTYKRRGARNGQRVVIPPNALPSSELRRTQRIEKRGRPLERSPFGLERPKLNTKRLLQ